MLSFLEGFCFIEQISHFLRRLFQGLKVVFKGNHCLSLNGKQMLVVGSDYTEDCIGLFPYTYYPQNSTDHDPHLFASPISIKLIFFAAFSLNVFDELEAISLAVEECIDSDWNKLLA